MGLGRREEGEVEPGVCVERGEDGDGEPQPGRGCVRAEEQGAQEGREEVGEDVLHRVAVDGGDGDGGGPLVVALVDVLVEAAGVEEPGREREDIALHMKAVSMDWGANRQRYPLPVCLVI